MRLLEEFDSLLEGGPENARFKIELSSIIRELEQGWGRSPEQIREEIESADATHPFVSFVVGLTYWIENRDYPNGADPALSDLREAIDIAIENEWDHLFPILIVQRIQILSELNHRSELAAEVKLGLLFLIEKGESIPIGPIFDILDAIMDNLQSISGTPAVRMLTEYLEDRADKALLGRDYRNYRDLLRRSLSVKKSEDLETDSVIVDIIESYNDEIQYLKSKGDQSLRANAAREAINDCIQWIGEEQRVEWEREFIEGNKLSIEQMAEISHEPTEEEIGELDNIVEEYVEGFKEQKEEKHAIYAIKWLLNHEIFVPDVEVARNISSGGLTALLARRTVSEAGESYSQEAGIENLPPHYNILVQFTQNIRQAVYYRLQNRQLVKEGDFYILFNRREVLSADTHAYLTDFIIHLFEHDPAAAIHLGMPQLEAVIRELAAAYGKSIMSRDAETGDLQRKGMGSLLYEVDGEVSGSWVTYLQYRYTDLSGQNVRNQIAHGYFPYKHTNWGMSILILFDILQGFLEFEEAYGK